jgi:hypothetical protein
MAAPRKLKRATDLSDVALLERLQSILINAAEGRRSLADDRQYQILRQAMTRRRLPKPSLLSGHPTVDSFTAAIQGIPDRRDRVERVRLDFSPAIRATDGEETVDSASWTGEPDRVARLKVIRTLLPLAQTAVESMIATLSEPNPNGGPLLDERVDAIEQLRHLHQTLGQLLATVDAGAFDDDLGQSLAAEAARYAKRAARALRDDPMPYLSAALLLGILSACGLPGIGGFLGGVALNIKKHSPPTRR